MGAHTSHTGRAEPWQLIEPEPFNIRELAAIGVLMLASFMSGAFLSLLVYGWITYRS